MSPTDWVASAGAAMLLLAFFLNQRGLMGEHSIAYLALNMIGAGTAALGGWMGGIIPFVVLEGVWSLVAGLGLLSVLRQRAAMAKAS